MRLHATLRRQNFVEYLFVEFKFVNQIKFVIKIFNLKIIKFEILKISK
jgi:hypothetical protein